ncbi:MAG: AAA family ATPase [Pseudomonadota bacterium]
MISGCSCGGKSTLIDALASSGYAVVPEPGRRIVQGENDPASPLLPWNNMACFAKRALDMAMSDFNQVVRWAGPVFFDRGIVDAAVALKYSTGAPELHGAASLYRYSSMVFVAPPWRDLFFIDGERRHDFSAAVTEYQRLIKAYGLLGYDIVKLPRVSVERRVSFIEEMVHSYGRS